MKGFDFRTYLRNYEIIQTIGTNKTKKQFKNFLRVMYGKKKDRGHIKKKVEKYIQQQRSDMARLYNGIGRVLDKYAPGITSMMGGAYGWF
jgi:hypothetical protein